MKYLLQGTNLVIAIWWSAAGEKGRKWATLALANNEQIGSTLPKQLVCVPQDRPLSLYQLGN